MGFVKEAKSLMTIQVPKDRVLNIPVPPDIPEGLVDVEVLIRPHRTQAPFSLADAIPDEFIGMWADRLDIGESPDYVRELRESLWDRG